MKERIVFIDLLRGWAALVMIEVHVFNAFLIPGLKQASWFEVLNFINGLVAPTFLFVAGMVFVVVSERKLAEFRSFGAAFRKQIGRIGMIWLIGYVLHLPVFSFTKILDTPESGWNAFFQSDILHCIAAGLLLLFTTRIIIRSEKTFSAVIFILGLAAVVGAPLLGASDTVRSLHPALRAYFDSRLSMFPLVPWLGFILWGGVMGMLYLRMSSSGAVDRFTRIVTWAGIAMVVVSIPALFGMALFPDGFDRQNDPLFFLLRFGLVLLLLMVCQWWVQRWKTESSLLLDAGRESLLVYVGHLQVLYATVLGMESLVDRVNGSFSPLECLAATMVLAALMVVAAKYWGLLKRRSRPLSRSILLAGSVVIIAVFFLQ
ncbi:MAG: heparan-alpha-glucosaminide N-acetyltransferase domain-containing protein [Bacteroidota bacterium]